MMAETEIATANPSRLLSLPRELRNNIYRHVGKDTVLGGDMKLESHACATKLFNGPNAALLQVCKQIHDEYEQVAFDRTCALFLMRTYYDLGSIAASLRTEVPLKILGSVKSVILGGRLKSSLGHPSTVDKRRAFRWAMTQDETVYDRLDWTPTKGTPAADAAREGNEQRLTTPYCRTC